MVFPDEEQNNSTICNECVLNVNNFYAFKQKVLNIQEILQEQQSTCNVESELHENIIRCSESKETIILHTDELSNDLETSTLDMEIIEKDEGTDIIVVDDYTEVSMANDDVFETKEDIIDEPELPVKRSKKLISNAENGEKFSLQVNECLICPSVLGDILQLNNHIQNHDVIRCKVCMRLFQRYANLKRHFSSMHSKPKPFICDICGLGFSFSVNLQAHANLHYSGKIKHKRKQ